MEDRLEGWWGEGEVPGRILRLCIEGNTDVAGRRSSDLRAPGMAREVTAAERLVGVAERPTTVMGNPRSGATAPPGRRHAR